MPTGIDIFSGVGGLSLGAELAGIEIRYAVEKDKDAAETYRFNHPGTLVLEDDIHKINPLEHLHENEHVSIVFGGPPCQGFSLSNTILSLVIYSSNCSLEIPKYINQYGYNHLFNGKRDGVPLW